MADETLPRGERLSGRGAVGRLFEQGAVGKGRLVLARGLPNGLDHNRVAFVAGRASGGAVIRARLRRRLRSAYRRQKAELPAGWDLALVARPGLLTAGFAEVCAEVGRAVRRLKGDHGLVADQTG